MRRILLFFIKKYKKNISHVLSAKGCNCKFYPTCSDYTMQAIEKYGSLKGSCMGAIRILRCNPLSKGGYDPLK